MFEHVQLDKIETRLSAVESSLALLHMTSQNILDAIQNTNASFQSVETAIQALVGRIPVPPDPNATILSPADAQAALDGVQRLGATAQSIANELNAILPAPTA